MSKAKQNKPKSEQIKPSTGLSANASVKLFWDRLSVFQQALLFGILSVGLGLYVFKMFIWGPYVYIFEDIGLDSLYTIYPNLLHLWDYIHQEGIPKWSFSQGVGQNIYPFWFDQFYFWILALDRQSIAGSMAYFQVIEIVIAGFMFRTYLKLMGHNPIVTTIGGLFYGFCGFLVVAGEWDNRFAVEVFNTALLLWSLEKYIRQHIWFWLPIPIALIAINQPFNLFIFGILIFLYTTTRYFESANTIKNWSILLCRIATISLIGVGLSSIISLSNIEQLLNSPRGSGEFSRADNLISNPIFQLIDGKELETFILRFFSSDLLGTGNQFQGWNNYFEAPLLYVGLLSLLAGSQFFANATRQQRLVYGLLGSLIILTIVLPYFRWAFWAFSGNYYRTFSFFIGLSVLLAGMKGLNQIIEYKQINKKILAATFVFLLLVLFFPFTFSDGTIDKSLRAIITAILILYFGILYFLPLFRQSLSLFLVLIVIFEIGYLAPKKFRNRGTLTTQALKDGYFNGSSAQAVAFLKKKDTSFYRLNEDKSVGPSDSKAIGYFGTSSYHSFNQLNYVRFLAAIGAIKSGDEYATRGIDQDISNIFTQSFLSSKYLILNQDNNKEMFLNTGFDSLAHYGNTLLTQFRYALPFGFTYNRYMLKEDFMKIPMWVKRKVLLDVAVIVPEQQKSVEPLLQQTLNQTDTTYATQYTLEALEKSVNERKKQHLSLQKYGQNFFIGSITLTTPQLLFFSIPFDNGWKLVVDNKVEPIQQVQIGFSGIVLPAGTHQIELTYTPPYQKEGSIVSLIFLAIYGALIFFFRRKNTAIVSL